MQLLRRKKAFSILILKIVLQSAQHSLWLLTIGIYFQTVIKKKNKMMLIQTRKSQKLLKNKNFIF
mgnify:CR=1 FL=1